MKNTYSFLAYVAYISKMHNAILIKKLENMALQCIATWSRLTWRQSFSALITRSIPSLKSVNLSVPHW